MPPQAATTEKTARCKQQHSKHSKKKSGWEQEYAYIVDECMYTKNEERWRAGGRLFSCVCLSFDKKKIDFHEKPVRSTNFLICENNSTSHIYTDKQRRLRDSY